MALALAAGCETVEQVGVGPGDEPCGNGELEPDEGEACDDGNTQAKDGCSATCQLERLRWELAADDGPPPRFGHGLAYDAARGEVVLFGGYDGGGVLADTWTWNGIAWTEKTTAVLPTARYGHALAYDSTRRQIVLFGGSDGSYQPLSDTWTWNGSSWVQRYPAASPAARSFHAMAADVQTEGVILSGGTSTGQFLDDTWTWNGTTWSAHDAAPAPAARFDHAMAPGVDGVMMFGGVDDTYESIGDGWIWDGNAWTPHEVILPTPRMRHAMARLGTAGQTILFGGLDGVGDAFGDTWQVAEEGWARMTDLAGEPIVGPSARYYHKLAFDEARGELVLFGGYDNTTPLGDTWRLVNAEP